MTSQVCGSLLAYNMTSSFVIQLVSYQFDAIQGSALYIRYIGAAARTRAAAVTAARLWSARFPLGDMSFMTTQPEILAWTTDTVRGIRRPTAALVSRQEPNSSGSQRRIPIGETHGGDTCKS